MTREDSITWKALLTNWRALLTQEHDLLPDNAPRKEPLKQAIRHIKALQELEL